MHTKPFFLPHPFFFLLSQYMKPFFGCSLLLVLTTTTLVVDIRAAEITLSGTVETVTTTRSNEFVCETPGETRKCIINHGEGVQTCLADLSWEPECKIQVCTRGRYLQSGACQLCPTGTYKDTTSIDPCTRCINAPRAHTKYINVGETSEDCAYICLDGFTRLCIRWQDIFIVAFLVFLLAVFLSYILFHSGVIRANSSSIDFDTLLSRSQKNAQI